MKIKIWNALNHEEEDAREAEVPDHGDLADGHMLYCLTRAAAEFMEKEWSDNDYPETMEVSVRLPSGELVELIASAQPTVDFVASLKE